MLITIWEDKAKQLQELISSSNAGPIFMVFTSLLAKKFSDATSLSSMDATRCYSNIEYAPFDNLKEALTKTTNGIQAELLGPIMKQFLTSTGNTVQELPITSILETVIPPGTQEEHVPAVVRNIIGKVCAFQLKITAYNIIQGCEEYTVTRVSKVPGETPGIDMLPASTNMEPPISPNVNKKQTLA